MIYVCEDCGFLFCRIGEVKECPSCEKKHIRSAITEEEQLLREVLEPGKTNNLCQSCEGSQEINQKHIVNL